MTVRNTEKIKEIMQLSSAYKRIKAFFELYPNVIIEPMKLSTIANVRDWERTLRMVREKESMNIEWIRPSSDNPMGGYIYHL